MKHNYSKKKYLNREELLDAARGKSKFSKEDLSTFSKRALKGIAQLEDSNEFESLLNKIDSKIDQRVTAERKTKGPSTRGSLFFLPRIAAAVLFLIAAAYFLLPGSPNGDALFAAHFEHLPSALPGANLERGAPDLKDLKASAFFAYEQQNYEEAIQQFDAYQASATLDLESQFYLGVALLGEGHTSRAINTLQTVKEQSDNDIYQEYSTWYLALAYLQGNQIEAAKPLIEQLANTAGDYQKQAQGLQKSL